MDTNMLRRTISNQLWGSSNNPSSRATMLLMAFGQFVDHDIAHVPFSQEIDCCDEEGNVKSDEDDCFPIKEGGAFRGHSVHLGSSVEPSFLDVKVPKAESGSRRLSLFPDQRVFKKRVAMASSNA